jgi:hypothetical protein
MLRRWRTSDVLLRVLGLLLLLHVLSLLLLLHVLSLLRLLNRRVHLLRLHSTRRKLLLERILERRRLRG